ncbi:MAG TPA: HD domain-containing protein [Anaerolineales bacterium]|nr:HD domain-containing protein [Anaerolineales bacterium]
MNQSPDLTALPTLATGAVASMPSAFAVPARHNPKLQTLVDRINADEELWQLWRCANVNAVDRLGMNDHGEVHIRIVANAALKLLRLLRDTGHVPGIVAHHHMTPEDAEVVVVLAAALHDLGISIHRDNHEEFSLALADFKAKELLTGLYAIRERTIVVSEVLHAIIAHHGDMRCLTLEAGVLKVADALDMAHGRSRIPFAAGSASIHAVSAAAIDEVAIKRGESRPVRVEIRMSNSTGVFQVNELLRRKLEHSTLARLVEIVARIESDTEKRLMPLYTLEVA